MRRVTVRSRNGKVYGPYFYDAPIGGKKLANDTQSSFQKTLSKAFVTTSYIRGIVSNVKKTVTGTNTILTGIPAMGKNWKNFSGKIKSQQERVRQFRAAKQRKRQIPGIVLYKGNKLF